MQLTAQKYCTHTLELGASKFSSNRLNNAVNIFPSDPSPATRTLDSKIGRTLEMANVTGLYM